MCDTLEEMRDNRDQKYSPSLVTDASHFYNLIVKFEFVATFVLSKLILDELLPVVQLNGTIKNVKYTAYKKVGHTKVGHTKAG